MKRVLSMALFALALPALAAAPRTYQVTGPVLELKDDLIVLENKDKERWEIARSADTKVTGELKVGARVTIQYRMTAASVEVKDEKPAAPKAGKK